MSSDTSDMSNLDLSSSSQEENKMISEPNDTKLQDQKFERYLKQDFDSQKIEEDKEIDKSKKLDVLENKSALPEENSSFEEKKPLICKNETFGEIVYLKGVPKEIISAANTVNFEDVKKDFDLVKDQDFSEDELVKNKPKRQKKKNDPEAIKEIIIMLENNACPKIAKSSPDNPKQEHIEKDDNSSPPNFENKKEPTDDENKEIQNKNEFKTTLDLKYTDDYESDNVSDSYDGSSSESESVCLSEIKERVQAKRDRLAKELITRSIIIKNSDRVGHNRQYEKATVERKRTDDDKKTINNEEKLEDYGKRKRNNIAEELNEFISLTSGRSDENCSPQKKKPKSDTDIVNKRISDNAAPTPQRSNSVNRPLENIPVLKKVVRPNGVSGSNTPVVLKTQDPKADVSFAPKKVICLNEVSWPNTPVLKTQEPKAGVLFATKKVMRPDEVSGLNTPVLKTQEPKAGVASAPKKVIRSNEVNGTTLNFKGVNNRPILLTADQNLFGLPQTAAFSAPPKVTVEPITPFGTTLHTLPTTSIPMTSFVPISPSIPVGPIFPGVGSSKIVPTSELKTSQVTLTKPKPTATVTSTQSQQVEPNLTQYQEVEGSQSLQCKHRGCDYQASIALEMQAHMDEMHYDKVVDNVDFMGKYLPYVDIRSQVQLVDTFHCKLCSYSSMSRHSLKIHMLKHDDDAPRFHCSRCPFYTKYKGNLMQHQRIHARNCRQTELKCDNCGHKLPHDVEKYVCEACPFETIYRRSMNSHKQKHDRLHEFLLIE